MAYFDRVDESQTNPFEVTRILVYAGLSLNCSIDESFILFQISGALVANQSLHRICTY